MSGGLPIGRIAGVPVVVDAWWAGISAFVGAAMFIRIYPGEGASAVVPVVVAVVGSATLLVSVLVHELSHAIAARRLGIGVRSVRLFVFGGYSELEGEPSRPRDELLVAAAGPAASVVFAIVLAALAVVVPDAVTGAGDVLRLLAVVNLAVAGFNLLPGLPLDGGRVLRGVLWRVTGDPSRATVIAAWAGAAIGAAVVVWGLVSIALSGSWVWAWNIVVGAFLIKVAIDAVRSVRPLSLPAGAVVERDVPVAHRDELARAAFARLTGLDLDRPVVVTGAERVIGSVTRRDLDVPGERRVQDVMNADRGA